MVLLSCFDSTVKLHPFQRFCILNSFWCDFWDRADYQRREKEYSVVLMSQNLPDLGMEDFKRMGKDETLLNSDWCKRLPNEDIFLLLDCFGQLWVGEIMKVS